MLALEVSPARGQGQWTELICSYDWDCDKAQRVMMCESKGEAQAFSSWNFGLYQINRVHQRRVAGGNLELLFDPATNVRVAHEIWSEQGWGPWVYCGRGA